MNRETFANRFRLASIWHNIGPLHGGRPGDSTSIFDVSGVTETNRNLGSNLVG